MKTKNTKAENARAFSFINGDAHDIARNIGKLMDRARIASGIVNEPLDINPTGTHRRINGKRVRIRSNIVCLNPNHDAQQIRYEREQGAIKFNRPESVLSGFARAVVSKVMRKSRRAESIAHLRDDMETEARSALHLWCAQQANPAAVLAWLFFTPRSAPKAARDSGVEAWPLDLWKAAFKACDAFAHKMARDYGTEHATEENAARVSYLSFLDAEIESDSGEVETLHATADEKRRAVNMRCDALLAQCRDKLNECTGNRARGNVNSLMRYIERAREYAHASIDSRAFKFRAPVLFHRESINLAGKCIVRKSGKFTKPIATEAAWPLDMARSQAESRNSTARSQTLRARKLLSEVLGFTFTTNRPDNSAKQAAPVVAPVQTRKVRVCVAVSRTYGAPSGPVRVATGFRSVCWFGPARFV